MFVVHVGQREHKNETLHALVRVGWRLKGSAA